MGWVQVELSDEMLSEEELRELVEAVRDKLGGAFVVVAPRPTVDLIPHERYL